MEELQPLGIVHVGGNLAAYLIDVDLLRTQLLEDLHALRSRLLAEVLAEEVPHAVQFGLERLAIGTDNGGGQHEEGNEEAVPLLVGGVSSPLGALLILPRALLAGALPRIGFIPAGELPGAVDIIVHGLAQQEADQAADGPEGDPSENTGDPFRRSHSSSFFSPGHLAAKVGPHAPELTN